MKTRTIIRAAVIGGSGYSGVEVIRLLSRHAGVSVSAVVAQSSAGQRLDVLYPDLTGISETVLTTLEETDFDGVDVAFVALPSGEGMHVVGKLRSRVGRIIDLGGDLRLKEIGLYERYYGHTHSAPELLQEAVYGLPELNRAAIARAHLVANPGCYPTSVILGLLPAVTAGLLEPEVITISAMSGVSGAGRSARVDLSFVEVNENIRAYAVTVHQHIPEMESILSAVAGSPVRVSFVPHLVPLSRGIYSTIHAVMVPGTTAARVAEAYAEYYRHAPFVRLRTTPPEIRAVTWTNFCDIAPVVEERTGRLIVMSVIDNLVKGAAGQAVQNMNIMFGVPEHSGLRMGEVA